LRRRMGHQRGRIAGRSFEILLWLRFLMDNP
jgi:hypothetical protein